MTRFKKLVYPVELTDISEKIAPFVVEMTRALGAELDVVHVIEKPEYHLSAYYLDQSVIKTEDQLIAEAGERLNEFCDRHLPDSKRVILVGDTVEEIVRYVAEQKVSMVILGTHGRKGIDRIVLGSVALRVVRRSPAPVLTVNPYLAEAGG